MILSAHFHLSNGRNTVFDHGFNEFAHHEYSCPVTTVDYDVAFASILGELFRIVVNKVALLDGRSE
jgi:hypothetical protein